MGYVKYATEQLKKYQKILLITGIIGLFLMCVALGIGLYQSTKLDNNTLIFLVPTVFGPLAMLPSIFSTTIGREIKKREVNN